MTVPYTFGTATSQIPLSQLDANFASPITIGNTAVQLGNTVTTLNNMTLANVTVSSGGNVSITSLGVGGASVPGSLGQITLYPTAVANSSGIFANDGADIANSAYLGLYVNSTTAYIDSGQSGAGTNKPLLIYTGGGEAARFDTSKNFIQITNTSVPSLTLNGQMVITRVNNTTLKFSLRGTDGVTRSATLTLA